MRPFDPAVSEDGVEGFSDDAAIDANLKELGYGA